MAAARVEAEATNSGYDPYYGVLVIHNPQGQRRKNSLSISAYASDKQTAAAARADSLDDDATAERICTEFDRLNDDFTKLDETDTFGRSGLMLHGGYHPGFSGCVDVGFNDSHVFDTILNIFRVRGYDRDLRILVGYR